jgi:hypothetical protein
MLGQFRPLEEYVRSLHLRCRRSRFCRLIGLYLKVLFGIRLPSICEKWYFHRNLDFRILLFKLMILSCSLILLLFIWPIFVQPATLFKNVISAVSILLPIIFLALVWWLVPTMRRSDYLADYTASHPRRWYTSLITSPLWLFVTTFDDV